MPSLQRLSFCVWLLISLSACQTMTYTRTHTQTTTTTTANTPEARLEQMLPVYAALAQHPWTPIPPTPYVLHLGMQNDTIALVRARLYATQDLSSNQTGNDIFDPALLQAVKKFQLRHGLNADGVVGNDTIAQMNISPAVRLHEIELNIKRWNALSQHTGKRYIMVNIPEYRLHLIDNGKETLTMKVVVGRPSRQTPELASKITRLELNPYWNVPDMIATKDIIPKQADDDDYLKSENIHIYKNENYEQEIQPDDVNWAKAKEDGFDYRFRQEPGAKNALGQVRFEFANSHDVYLHDTPAKNLFASDTRDFSSGCVRLEKPLDLVAYLVAHDPQMSMPHVQTIIKSDKNTYYTLKDPIPIYITYITAWVDDQGNLHFAHDVYGRDS